MSNDEQHKMDQVLKVLQDMEANMNKHFQEIDKRFEQVNKHFGEIENRLERMERDQKDDRIHTDHEMMEMRRRIMKLEVSR